MRPLPLPLPSDPDELLGTFTDWATGEGLSLYPHQKEALLELATGSHVVLATPTGSGKSLVAIGAHAIAMASGRRTYYTAPIKALVSEKFFALCEVFGAENVGMLTGDAAVNASAPIICCTAEVLANIALRGDDGDVGQVVMDEFHFYAEPDRGWAWQVPLLLLPRAQFLLMSATLGDLTTIKADLERRTGVPVAEVSTAERPVPLTFSWALTPLHETLEELLTTHQAPVYVVHFTQAAALERAQSLTSINVASREDRDKIAAAIGEFRFAKGFGQTLSRLLRHGIGVHHAGMLPKYRRLVERLTQDGLLKVVCGTDTLGVGINVPIRTVVLTGLTKYDGRRQRLLKAREFHQIAGRAGRAGYDTIGTVVVQAPDHVVENHRLVTKAGDDPKKLKRVQRKKPPEGQITWTEDAFERLVAAQPEQLVSRMRIDHGMLLNLLSGSRSSGVETPWARLRTLLRDNHEDGRAQVRLVRRAVALYRTLLAAGVVVQDDDGCRVVEDTGEGSLRLALNQPLSTFALAAFELLDPESDTFALDVVSIIESTLDDPRAVLRAQEHVARGEAIGEMKADGVEYDERMELLEEVSWPKPLAEVLEAAYELYAGTHPWVLETPVSPKSVVREMWERAMTFGEYVAAYKLARSEGVLLRYLSDAYRALRQTVPESVRTEEVADITAWLGAVVRQTDSSLLDEWEALVHPEAVLAAAAAQDDIRPPAPKIDERGLRVLVRNAMFRLVELVARRDAAGLVELHPDGPSEGEWAEQVEAYFAEYADLGTGAEARGPALLVMDGDEVAQILDDPEGDRDWRITATIDREQTQEQGELVLEVHGLAAT
ncbi:DEAD/DEAH box helicase [Nocardioides massiliensis]|uniref:Superfamily II RNA helicase n=1 Tax=Nocardioides massiliensis TaxID=1325935 RepID=A0ABT9NJG5_9ACTN|nr:DEAD/DEAH box helicase [Nocardioides massiliensis]MDP9820558.1 superfamily II RNA helicase [Nocardioides massiliensis]